MDRENLIKLFDSCNSIAEICYKLYGKHNGGMHNKVLHLFKKIGYDWDVRLKQINESKRVFCLNCGKEIFGHDRKSRKFCSKSCAATYNNTKRKHTEEAKLKIANKLRKERNTTTETKPLKPTLYCKNCNKILKSNQLHFCSKKCRIEYNEVAYSEYIKRWLNGEENGNFPSMKIHNYVKRYLMEKHNNCCQECGWGVTNEHTGRVPLQIHHIDGDCTNNREDNLQLLCPNCHSLTENFGSRNKNSKRVFRKQKLYHLEYET